METIFDIATPEELENILGRDFSFPDGETSYSFTLKSMKESSDYRFSRLASLFANRGDLAKADGYIEQIKDDIARLDASMSIYECE